MSEQQFNFTEWSDEQLQARLNVIKDKEDFTPQDHTRGQMLGREVCNIMFEIDCRLNRDQPLQEAA